MGIPQVPSKYHEYPPNITGKTQHEYFFKNGMPMPTFILKHKLPHGFLCFATHSLKNILEKSEEVFMLRVRIPDKGVMVVSSLYLPNIGTL